MNYSVIMPYYTNSTIIDSIRSVIDQTYRDIELMIIDDGSQDGTVKTVRKN